MRVVVLPLECLQLNLVQSVYILLCRVLWHRLCLLLRLEYFVDVTDAQSVVHTPKCLVHVMHIRRLRRHLHLRLCKRNALGLTEDIWVRYRDYIHTIIKIRGHNRLISACNGKWILLRQAFAHNTRQKLKFTAHCIVHALMNGTHDPRALLQHRYSGPNRRILVAIAHFHVRNRRKTLSSLHNEAQKVKQRLIGPFKRQRHEAIADSPTRSVHVAELAGLKRIVVISDTQSARLEARREIGQRTCVDQLPQCCRGGTGKPANRMN